VIGAHVTSFLLLYCIYLLTLVSIAQAVFLLEHRQTLKLTVATAQSITHAGGYIAVAWMITIFSYTVNIIRISTDMLWRVLHRPISAEPLPYTLVSVIRRNDETHVWTRASLFRRLTCTDTNVYGTGSVKMCKTRRKISADIRIFFIVQCH